MLTSINEDILNYSESLDDTLTVSRFIKTIISSVINWTKVEDIDNFFSLGINSLQALMTTRKFKQSQIMNMIELSTIYINSFISKFTNIVFRFSKQQLLSKASEKQAHQKIKNDLLQECQILIDQILIPPEPSEKVQSYKVILTSSTGALDLYILYALLAEPACAKVYCLNQAIDGMSLQAKRNRIRGLPVQFDSSRVTFWTINLSQKYLGLEFQIYNQLLDEITHVIHTTWPVNFLVFLNFFRPHLINLVNLIEFTTRAKFLPNLLLISFISFILSYRTASLRIQEQVITFNSLLSSNGYAESKYLSERLFDHAIQRLPVNLSFARVEQIAGAVKFADVWNRAEWFSSLITSSHHIRVIPESLGFILNKIDWVLINLLAKILVELALSHHLLDSKISSHTVADDISPPHEHLRVWHPLNPHSTTWNAIKTVITNELSCLTKRLLKIVNLKIWIRKIRSDAEETISPVTMINNEMFEAYLARNSAVKLLDFYESLLFEELKGNELKTKKTKSNNERLRALEGIKVQWVRKWVQELF